MGHYMDDVIDYCSVADCQEHNYRDGRCVHHWSIRIAEPLMSEVNRLDDCLVLSDMMCAAMDRLVTCLGSDGKEDSEKAGAALSQLLLLRSRYDAKRQELTK